MNDYRTDPNVPLCPAFNDAVMRFAHMTMPQGWDVLDEAPVTLESLTDYYRRTGRIAVNRSNGIGHVYGDAEVHFAFRAWHDLGHVLHQAPFSLAGEMELCQLHARDLKALYPGEAGEWFARLVEVEIVAANFANYLTEWPADLRRFALDYLEFEGVTQPPLLRQRADANAASFLRPERLTA